MISLLKNQFVNYLNSRKPHLPPFNGSCLNVRSESISDPCFDIMDKKETIAQPIGKGSATYNNPNGIVITFIDFEGFINQLPPDLQKDLKRCDFLAYDLEGLLFFILNELSLSSSAKNKLSDAIKQLHQVVFYFYETSEIKDFISKYRRKQCIFSNKHELIQTPDGVADAFNLIQGYLHEPIFHKYQPIEKLGFELIETAVINV